MKTKVCPICGRKVKTEVPVWAVTGMPPTTSAYDDVYNRDRYPEKKVEVESK